MVKMHPYIYIEQNSRDCQSALDGYALSFLVYFLFVTVSLQVGVGQLSKSQQLLRLIRERGGTAQFWEIQVGAACPYLIFVIFGMPPKHLGL